MSQKLGNAQRVDQVTQNLIQHCVDTTKRSRDWMETNPNQRLPRDYRAFPGKQDHTTCMTVRATRISLDDLFQFKIDEVRGSPLLRCR